MTSPKAKKHPRNSQQLIHCALCGKLKEVMARDLERGARFCSNDCYHLSTRRDPNAQRSNNHICKMCKKPFYHYKSKTKFCSKPCIWDYRRQFGRGENHPQWKPKVAC